MVMAMVMAMGTRQSKMGINDVPRGVASELA